MKLISFREIFEKIGEIVKIVILALVIVIPIRYFIFQPFVVKGASMEPNFQTGDYLIIDEITYRFREPQRGEVVVFKYPKDPSNKFIKRIIGLPGEKIELKDDKIIITNQDGKKIILNEEDYLKFPYVVKEKEFILPSNYYFVLGDNRPYSFDSEEWGVLAKRYIIGKAFFRIFPLVNAAYFKTPKY